MKPPKSWGQITGTVPGATDDGTTLLAGAEVRISARHTPYTVRTGQDGGYAVWLEADGQPVSVTVSKDRYRSASSTVKPRRGRAAASDPTPKTG